MNERVAQYVNKVKTRFQQMGRNQKIWLFASLIGLIVAIVLITVIFTRTEYEVAFTKLDANDSAAVINHLESAGIPYKLNATGSEISIPAKDAARVKIDVGSQGLIQNGSLGFAETFGIGSSALGTTENEFNVKYQNAINGEVQRLLNGLSGIESSKVLVTKHEESVFLTTQEMQKPTAAVVLNFTPGYRPTQKEIDGYYNLIKAAVGGIDIQDITISSQQHGELLSSEANDLLSGGTNLIETQFNIQKKYEQELKNTIQQYLSQIYGVDKIVVSISSSLNFDKKSSQESLVLPLENNNNNGIIISEQLESTSSTSTDASGGVVGTGETDIPTYQTGNAGGENSSESNSTIRNYDVNRINNIIESQAYVVKDLSISVGFEASELASEADQQAITNYLASFVRSQLANSGQDLTNDQAVQQKVTLIARDFDAEAAAAADETGLSTAWIIGLAALALLLIAALIFVLLRRRKAKAEEEEELVVEDIPVRPAYETIDLDNLQNDSQARKNLETLAKRKPDEFVNLLRTWLVDE
ncbi:flagellar M-ring protein [Paenibacillus montaniterrae]|uniref:Flagellar M-ring protein n=1 Tax=Paenibacillus montaniterrae TaxID=429341 RepID=A0A920CX00_9BACL|nr:flagellar basal-body MS-ring/collar protein FliF [Paenibacillus montaniterrae]GIP14544.1 flagellar M-ring protein [Paenibacillus montaniterrae]